MRHLLRVGIGAALLLLAACSNAAPVAPLTDAFVPLPGESVAAFENRCLDYVSQHASFGEAATCMNRAGRMRRARGRRLAEVAAMPAPMPGTAPGTVPGTAPGTVPGAGSGPAATPVALPAGNAPTPLAPPPVPVPVSPNPPVSPGPLVSPAVSPPGSRPVEPVAQKLAAVTPALRHVCGTSITEGTGDGGRTVGVTISGMITLGCKARLDRVMATARARYPKGQLYFVLNSPGGALQTAMRMGRVVELDQLPVVVPPGGMCASACFLILAASRTKYVSQTAHVGVHSAAESRPGHETVGSKAVTTDFARILAQLGVPSAIVGHLVETPPGEIYWLTPDELMAMGVRLLPT